MDAKVTIKIEVNGQVYEHQFTVDIMHDESVSKLFGEVGELLRPVCRVWREDVSRN